MYWVMGHHSVLLKAYNTQVCMLLAAGQTGVSWDAPACPGTLHT